MFIMNLVIKNIKILLINYKLIHHLTLDMEEHLSLKLIKK